MREVSSENEIILQLLKKRFQLEKDSKLKAVEVMGNDFNAASFFISTKKDNKAVLTIKYRLSRLGDFLTNEGISEKYDTELKDKFGEWYCGRDGDDLMFELNTVDISDEDKAKALDAFPKLQVNIMAPIFKNSFEKAQNKAPVPTVRIPSREDESIYLLKNEGNVLVYFTILLDAGVDRELGSLFIQELKDAKRGTGKLGSAPTVNFTAGAVPQELLNAGIDIPEKTNEKDYIFVVFSLFDRHIANNSLYATVTKLVYFRPYLDFHLKCTKGYMHIRFRDRVVKLMEQLEAAKDTGGIEKIKKTASGRFLSSYIASERGRV